MAKINVEKLQAPVNIIISYMKINRSCKITWNQVSSPKKVYYNIYKGYSPNGIFYKQNKEPLEYNSFEDRSVSINPNTTNWYKVSTLYKEDDKYIEGPLSSPVKYEVLNTNKWFNKINERNMWILKNTGQLFDLYIYKTEGEKCPKCYDKIRGRGSDPNCNICYGTGIDGGYEPIYQLYVRQKPATSSLDLTNSGLQINNSPGAWTISDITLRNRDLLINPQGIIFEIISTNINHAAGYYFHQELQMKEIPPTHPLYNMHRKSLYPIF